MTTQLIKSHWYGNVAANAVGSGAAWSRNLSTGNVTFDIGGTNYYSSNNVDRLLCSDVIVAFDYYGPMGQCYRLYNAAFGRVPDQDGLSANVNVLDAGGATLRGIAAAFLGGVEGTTRFGSASDAGFIVFLYETVLLRDPSPAEVTAWLANRSSFATNALWRADTLVGFSESTENNNLVNPSILPGVKMTISPFFI